MKIMSWNVNGLRACCTLGFERFVAKQNPDIVCCQEIKTKVDLNLPDYHEYWNLCTARKGYSGTLVLSKEEPINIITELGCGELDKEGRFMCLEYSDFCLINVYVPNAEHSLQRLDVRKEWDNAIQIFISKLSKAVVLCGDLNVAIESVDVYPENLKNKRTEFGFDTETRDGIKRIIKTCNLIDVYRAYNPTQDHAYTWWSSRLFKRLENRGWRLDYFLISKEIIGEVESVRHLTDVLGSDHCPIELQIRFWHPKCSMELSSDEAGDLWAGINWPRMEQRLYAMQHKLAVAAASHSEEEIERLSGIIVNSFPAKVLAVRKVADSNASPGIDHVKWVSGRDKMQAALSLTADGYHHRPYHCFKIYEDKGKERIIRVATQYDKAMDVLYSFALKPIAEVYGDPYSFGAREGRSAFDVHSCIVNIFSGANAPVWGLKADVEKCYDSINHDWLLSHIPMDRHVLHEFLKAGVLDEGILHETDEGITQGSSISPVLGNLTLDGIEDYISNRMFSDTPAKDRKTGRVVRFIDDIIISASSKEEAERIKGLANDFLLERGLKFSEQKTKVFNIYDGFDFLSYHFFREGDLIKSTPSAASVRDFETRLERYIIRYKGSISPFIQGLNRKLSGWASYQRVTEAYDTFRHIDVVVQSLLLKKMKMLHPKRNLSSIQEVYWQHIGERFVFSNPDKRDQQVISLAELAPTYHVSLSKPSNPYLNKSYAQFLANVNDISRVSGDVLKSVWRRQNGYCYTCGRKILTDQELSVVQILPGEGIKASNLAYVHKRCAHSAYNSDMFFALEGMGIDTLSMLGDIAEDRIIEDDPYYGLREYFRTCKFSPVTLTFKKIEEIVGDELDWPAYFSDAFWYDSSSGFAKKHWDKSFPHHAIKLEPERYCIADSWLSQGYIIQRLRREDRKIVFRKQIHNTSGLEIPKVLTDNRIPTNARYEIEEFCTAIIKKYGLR